MHHICNWAALTADVIIRWQDATLHGGSGATVAWDACSSLAGDFTSKHDSCWAGHQIQNCAHLSLALKNRHVIVYNFGAMAELKLTYRYIRTYTCIHVPTNMTRVRACMYLTIMTSVRERTLYTWLVVLEELFVVVTEERKLSAKSKADIVMIRSVLSLLW